MRADERKSMARTYATIFGGFGKGCPGGQGHAAQDERSGTARSVLREKC